MLDPPKLAPTAAHAERAARAYKDINRLALTLLEPGGVLFTYSCSGGISADLFHKIVASRRRRRRRGRLHHGPAGCSARPSDDAEFPGGRIPEGAGSGEEVKPDTVREDLKEARRTQSPLGVHSRASAQGLDLLSRSRGIAPAPAAALICPLNCPTFAVSNGRSHHVLIPATILTGFLGSGKTTLLKRVLGEAHGQKIAVIENEFGEENIDSDILVSDTQEQIIQMSNGCICCTIREDLRATLQLLAAKKRKGLLDFDRVVIETTGLADPGPVAQTFFMDDEIAETYLLDSILTLVDAKHAAQQLNDRQEARRQVGFADQIFISKTDLVAAEETDALMHRLKHMNPRAPQKAVHFGEVTIAEVFDLRGFNLNAKLDIDPDFLKEDETRSRA